MSDKLDIELDLDFLDEEDTQEVESVEEENDVDENEEHQEDIEEVDNKKIKLDIKSIISKKNVKELNKQDEYALYILIDNKVNQLGGWLNKLGIYPTYISDNLEEFSDTIETEYEKCVVVIVDTGMGEFNSIENSTKLINLLGMDVFEDKHFFMLYSDDTIKVDARAKLGKTNIKWLRYKGSKDIYNLIKRNHIKIVEGEPYDYKEYDMSSLDFKAKPINEEEEREFMSKQYEEVEEAFELFKDSEKECIEGFPIVV